MPRAAAAGMVMVRGECLPLAGTLPLLPVADALGELARLEGGGLLAAALDAAAGMCGQRWGGCCRSWARVRAGPGRPGRGVAAGAAVRRRWRSCWPRWPRRVGVGLVVEDVHWADSETLDFLTFLARAGRWGPVRVVVTCRRDEAPLAAQVAGWLAQVRGGGGVGGDPAGPAVAGGGGRAGRRRWRAGRRRRG